ncbi:MAG: hypothetical protein LBR67_03880 [Dysgonamonadaceae bacterium]|jgi:hypothetical protein|nr:hypothetical protein [Dysgonamonadaceae bacterium]
MNRIFITIAFCFSISTIANAQQSFTLSSSTKSGLTVYVYDVRDQAHLPDAQVVLIMDKDTIRETTDYNGEVNYNGRFLTDSVEITVSHPEYITQSQNMIVPPNPNSAKWGIHFYPKKKENADAVKQ